MRYRIEMVSICIALTRRFAPVVIFVMAMMIFHVTHAQKTDAVKARKYFDKARNSFEAGEYTSSLKNLSSALRADSAFADAYILYADILLETGRPEQAVKYYNRSLEYYPDDPEIVWNLLGNTLFSLERYDEACPCFDSLLNAEDIRPDLRKSIQERLSLCHFRREQRDNPVEFLPVNLDSSINTRNEEYINALSADGSCLYFTRREATAEPGSRPYVENFYFSGFRDGAWQTSTLLGYPEGSENDAGALCISPDGNLLIFTSCFRRDGFGSCDLYYSERVGEAWTPAKNMGSHINSEMWDAQPSISPDGRTLYFASNRKNGCGSSDIWAARRLHSGEWTRPYNLGPVINTSEAEMGPFIHYDNQTLYFSSKGHAGQGGSDLFRSSLAHNTWQEPMNLGYPINTGADELLIIVNPDGKTGYMSSNTLEGKGGYDIFSFELYEGIRPIPVTYLKGRVYDQDDRRSLSAAFELIDLSTDSVIMRSNSNKADGEFLVCLPFGRDYALHAACPGYLFYSEHFPLMEIKTSADPLVRDVPMKRIAPGSIMVLNNVFFDTDRYDLTPVSVPELERLVIFLDQNPSVSVEISGHTDNTGTEEHNRELSWQRAKTVYLYLLEKGIDPGRLTYEGYGESRPVASNEDEKGRSENRRTEIKIVQVN